MKKLKVLVTVAIIMILFMVGIVNTNTSVADSSNNTKVKAETVLYNSYVNYQGWEKSFSKKNGAISGTTKNKKALGAVKIKLNNMPKGVTLKYQIYVRGTGWQNWTKEGKVARTGSSSKNIGAIRIKLVNTNNYSIQYSVYVQGKGWQNWAIDGETAGKTGKVSAIKIKVVPKVIKAKAKIETNTSNIVYDENTITVSGYYLANTANKKLQVCLDNKNISSKITYAKRTNLPIGYGGTENTPKAGFSAKVNLTNVTKGNHKLRIKLLDSEGNLLASSSRTIYVDSQTPTVKYQTYVLNRGWQTTVRGYAQSNNKGSQVQAIKIKLVGNFPENASIMYRTRLQGKGWQSWVSNNTQQGNTGKSNRIEAIRIKLANVDNKYSVEYNAYVQGMGWQGWANDGEIAGTVKQNKRIEKIKIRIVPKITETKAKISIETPNMSSSSVNVRQENTTISGWTMTNQGANTVRIEIDGKTVVKTATRKARQDVLDKVKGYGGVENNSKPGFTTSINFKNYSLGKHTLSIKVLDKNEKVLCQANKNINVQKTIAFSQGTYGSTGLKVKNSSKGSTLKYYKLGERI